MWFIFVWLGQTRRLLIKNKNTLMKWNNKSKKSLLLLHTPCPSLHSCQIVCQILGSASKHNTKFWHPTCKSLQPNSDLHSEKLLIDTLSHCTVPYLLNVIVIWHVTPRSLVEWYKHYRGTCCLRLQSRWLKHMGYKIEITEGTDGWDQCLWENQWETAGLQKNGL